MLQSTTTSYADYIKNMMETQKIFSDQEVFAQIKDKSRQAYEKSWKAFKTYISTCNFEMEHPGKEDLISYFNHLRKEKKMATSSIWTHYSYINSILKRKYGYKMQSLPRITMVIKGYEEDMDLELEKI